MCVPCSLVYRLMGRVKEVQDSTAGAGNCYYQSLLNSKNEVHTHSLTSAGHAYLCLGS